MSVLELLSVPSAVVVTLALLLLTVWLEQRFLSPRFLITQVVRVRNTPEHAERIVAAQAEALLRGHQRRP
jgi:hypothetical protein